MPFILRKIRKSRWYAREDVPWLAEGELQADPLGDLQTSNNELSVWQIEGDESNLDRIIAALAASCDHVRNLDYIIFDKQVLSELNIQIESSKASTPDEEANALWHYDLIKLSAQKLVNLTKALIANITNVKPRRILKKEIRQLIKNGVDLKRIDRTKLKQSVQTDIDRIDSHN